MYDGPDSRLGVRRIVTGDEPPTDGHSQLSTPESAELPTDRVRKVESLLTDWLHDADVPGTSVVVVDAEGERYAAGFGAREMESNAPASPDTLYAMASITKPFTSLATLQLVEDGRIAVEDSVDDYVDHYVDAPGDPITIGELLSHTSGMPASDPGYFDQRMHGRPAGVADRADLKRWVQASTEARVTEEDRYFYYNLGYEILGLVIEAVDGRRYAEYVQEEILAPLGMARATFEREAVESDDDVMTGYKQREDGDGLEKVPFPFEDLITPAGGLVSSCRDLSRFLRAMMTDGELDGERVCSPEIVERLQQGRTTIRTALDGTETKYGYGWVRSPVEDDEVVFHDGGMPGATSFAGFLEDAGIGLVVACNTGASPPPARIGLASLAVLTGQDPTAIRGIALREKCEAVAGTYEPFQGPETVTVEPEAGGIAVEISRPDGEQRLTAYPSSLDPDEHDFYYVDGGANRALVEFDLDGDRADLYIGRHRYRRKQPGG